LDGEKNTLWVAVFFCCLLWVLSMQPAKGFFFESFANDLFICFCLICTNENKNYSFRLRTRSEEEEAERTG